MNDHTLLKLAIVCLWIGGMICVYLLCKYMIPDLWKNGYEFGVTLVLLFLIALLISSISITKFIFKYYP